MPIKKVSTMMSFLPEQLIDLDRYPIHDLQSEAGQALIKRCRQELEGMNSCVLRGFIKKEVEEQLVAEARQLAEQAFYYEKFGLNCYRTQDDPRFPKDHPRRLFYDVKEGVVAYDLFSVDSMLRRVYQWKPLADFLAQAFDKPALYPFDDPFQALNIMVISENEEEVGMGWHFDENEYTITLMMQPPEQGGEFEFVPNIRTPWDENYRAVQKVLQGDREGILQEAPEFGMLALFRGGYSLHRVAPVKGKISRLQCIATFEKEPGQKASDQSSINIYGPRIREVLQAGKKSLT
jgi:hypothetical protein